MTRLTQCSREGRTAPPPRFFPLLKPCTPASLKSNFYAPSVLLPPAPLTHRRYCLRVNQVSGQQKARRRDSQGHSIRERPGCSGLTGPSACGPAPRTTARASGSVPSQDVRGSGGRGGVSHGNPGLRCRPPGDPGNGAPLTVSLCLPAGLRSTITRPR